ncbi:MAG: hypothetical protein JEZ07_00805 [Phycisphaerae bacterium]|nr:hypothetical protein [Phycisphaerae bacterium]
MKKLMILIAMPLMISGCGNLRLAPNQDQKQNAYLHFRTTQTAAQLAHDQNYPQTMQDLTNQSVSQSSAILNYYGMPEQLPESDNAESILSQANNDITTRASHSALQRPDPWSIADDVLQVAIGIAGVFGGLLGGRVVNSLKVAKEKSTALKEIVQGNEIFKAQNPQSIQAFKQAQQNQSQPTKKLVMLEK